MAISSWDMPAPRAGRLRIVRALNWSMEGLVLLVVVVTPWVFGAVHAYFEFYLHAILGVLLLLWAAKQVVAGELVWKHCGTTLCLGGLLLLALVQAFPLPTAVVEWASPNAVAWRKQLLPDAPEVIAGERATAVADEGDALSLAPAVTRTNAFRLLTLVLFFAVVRQNVASPAAFYRLSIVALANGALLSFFAIAQRVSAPPNLLFGQYAFEQPVFGTFICRNHFPFYINLCIGLGVGLLFATYDTSEGRSWEEVFAAPLHQPAVLWISVALALCIAGVGMSLSRGGIAALLGAGAIATLFAMSRAGIGRRLAISLLVVLGVLAAGTWFGLEELRARLADSWKADPLEEGRLAKWRSLTPLLADFPIWGTGLGTFPHVEPIYRQPGERLDIVWEHTHNEYLEALLEGGVIRLLLSLTAIGIVLFLGLLAYRRLAGRSDASLALGGLFAFATVLLHSFVDFGLHVPAVAVLTACVTANLCQLGKNVQSEARPAPPTRYVYATKARVAAPLAAVVLSALAVTLMLHGFRTDQAERLRLSAARERQANRGDAPARRIAALEAAVSWSPADAELHMELSEAYFARGRQHASGEDIRAGMRHALAARSRNILLTQPHLRLAGFADYLERGDPRRVYLARAQWLRPNDAEVWFITGLHALEDRLPEETWPAWRRSLECSSAYLEPILTRTGPRLAPGDIVAKVMPDAPVLLVLAAQQLYPKPEEVASRAPFYRKAVSLFAGNPPANPSEHALRAEACRELGLHADAVRAYRLALAGFPTQNTWRFALAETLLAMGDRSEAGRELRAVLDRDPSHAAARALLERIEAGM
jgi:O-antigen ligase